MPECQCPCHSLAIPHPVTCPECQPLPVSWYACGFCGADKHHCCRSTASDRRYPMGTFHQRREQVARQLNLYRGLK